MSICGSLCCHQKKCRSLPIYGVHSGMFFNPSCSPGAESLSDSSSPECTYWSWHLSSVLSQTEEFLLYTWSHCEHWSSFLFSSLTSQMQLYSLVKGSLYVVFFSRRNQNYGIYFLHWEGLCLFIYFFFFATFLILFFVSLTFLVSFLKLLGQKSSRTCPLCLLFIYLF